MIQLILTYIIVAAAVFYVLFNAYEFFFVKKTKCACSGSCGLKSEILENLKNKPNNKFINKNIKLL
jgi:hypothetical protein